MNANRDIENEQMNEPKNEGQEVKVTREGVNDLVTRQFSKKVFSIFSGQASDVQWFKVENKMRGMIESLLEPLKDDVQRIYFKQRQFQTDIEKVNYKLIEADSAHARMDRQYKDIQFFKTTIEQQFDELSHKQALISQKQGEFEV